jgi:hypothetical protein
MDLAGPWVLVCNETGTQTGKKAWVHKSKLTFLTTGLAEDLEELLRIRKIQANREHASRGIAQGRSDQTWGVSCLVCFGPLQQPHAGKPVATWLYCPKCDRMQRHQLKPVQSEPLRRKKPLPAPEEPDARPPAGPAAEAQEANLAR